MSVASTKFYHNHITVPGMKVLSQKFPEGFIEGTVCECTHDNFPITNRYVGFVFAWVVFSYCHIPAIRAALSAFTPVVCPDCTRSAAAIMCADHTAPPPRHLNSCNALRPSCQGRCWGGIRYSCCCWYRGSWGRGSWGGACRTVDCAAVDSRKPGADSNTAGREPAARRRCVFPSCAPIYLGVTHPLDYIEG